MLMTGDRVRVTSGAYAGREGDVTSILLDRAVKFYQVTLAKTDDADAARARSVRLFRQDELEEIRAYKRA